MRVYVDQEGTVGGSHIALNLVLGDDGKERGSAHEQETPTPPQGYTQLFPASSPRPLALCSSHTRSNCHHPFSFPRSAKIRTRLSQRWRCNHMSDPRLGPRSASRVQSRHLVCGTERCEEARHQLNIFFLIPPGRLQAEASKWALSGVVCEQLAIVIPRAIPWLLYERRHPGV